MHRGSSSILLATFFKHPVESLHFEACNPFSFLKLALLSTGMMPWILKFAFHWCPALLKRISLVLWFWLWPRLVTSKVALKGISVVPPPQNWPWLWMGLGRGGNQWMRPKCTESKWQLYTVHVIVQWQSWLSGHCTDSALSKCNVLRFLKLHPQ